MHGMSGCSGWVWDESLYSGSASYYARGRLPYPPEIGDVLRETLHLDGPGRLLDVGCGPGSLSLVLAPLFAEVVGIDADADMVAEARQNARAAGVLNADWRCLRAEDLPAGLGSFRVATFAQSFHWMDREQVARRVRAMIEPGGAWVHVNATTHRGAGTDEGLPAASPPRDEITESVQRYVGSVRRAGRMSLPEGTPAGEEEVMAEAGFVGPVRIEVGGGRVIPRSEDDVVASVYSLSSAAPHLFGDRLGAFEAELRALLRRVSPTGRFVERTREIELVIWRP
jgi:SAM-dependent methyltransferase